MSSVSCGPGGAACPSRQTTKMKAQRTAFVIYIVGVSLLSFALGAFEARAQALLESWFLLAAAIAYLVLMVLSQ